MLCVLCCRLEGLPLYMAGVSAGASFALKMPRLIKVDGILSEVLGINTDVWKLEEVVAGEGRCVRCDWRWWQTWWWRRW